MPVSDRAGSHSEKVSEASKHSGPPGRNGGWTEKAVHEDTGAEVGG